MVSEPSKDFDEDAPLDPELEKIRVRMSRFVFGSIGFMLLGLFAVLLVILYRVGVFSDGTERSAQMVEGPALMAEAHLPIPEGAQIMETSLDGQMVALRLRLSDGGQALHVFDLSSGAVIGRYAITAE